MKTSVLRIVCLAAALALSGCIKVKQLVVVQPDGSGHIVVSTVFPPETVQMMSSIPGLQGAGAAAQAIDPFYDEDQLRSAAAQFGEGVELSKAQRIDSDGARGAIAVYAFKDINRVKMNTRQNMDMNQAMEAMNSGVDSSSGDFIRFAFARDDRSTLTIRMPQLQGGGGALPPPAEQKAAATQLPPELAALGGLGGLGGGTGGAMALQMFKGLEMSFAVQVKGEVLKHNAGHPDHERKDRFHLLGLNLDELMKSPEFQKLAGQDIGGDQAAMMRKIYALPGANLETNREVVIEFK